MIGCNIDKMKIEVMKMMRSQAFKTSTGKISNARNVELSDNNIITVSYGNNRGGYSAARKQTNVIYNNIINKLKEENLPVGKDYEYVIETTDYNDKVIELQLRIPPKLITLYELRNKTEEGEYESLQQAIREYNRNKITQEDTSMDKGIGIDYFGDNIKGQKLNTYPTDNLSKKTKKVLDFVLKNFPKIANNTIIHRNQKEFDDLTANTEFENTGGIYAFDDETGLIHIYINPSKENAETFVHETVHAFTEVILNNPQTPEEIKFVHLVNDLYSQFRKMKGAEKLNDGYQFKDISEFLVYSLTNTEMQEFIKSNNTSKLSLEKVINFIKSLFGLTQSQFDELFNSFKSVVSTTDYSKIKERILKSNLETKGQLSESELRILTPVIEKFETDIRELNTFNIRELQAEKNEQQGKPVSVKETEFLKSSKFSDGYILNLGSPSSILRKIGMPNLPITLGTRWFLDHIIRNPEHNLKLLNLRGLVEAIHNPIAILQDKAYKGKDGRIETLTTVESRDGKPVNVIIQFNKRFGELEVNSITTAFETDLFRFQKATRENSVLYIDKERITNYLQGVLLPSTLQKITDQKGILVYPKSISDSSTNVEKFLHYVDNFPNILTTEEKNKQVRISKGQNINPTEVKPGIEELFNENPTLANEVYSALGFKQVYQGYNKLDNREINYFTVDKNEASDYGNNIRTVVLNTNYLLKGNSTEYYRLVDEDYKTTNSRFDILDNSKEGIKKQNQFFNFLKERGYEGVDFSMFSDTRYIVSFGNNQITPQQKQQARQLYVQYLLQNPNGSVEGFKSWVEEFNKNNKLLQESGSLTTISKSKIDNLQSTVEYQLLNEKDEDLDKKIGQSYMFLSEKDAQRFASLVERNKEFPKEFQVTKKITKYEKDSKNPLKSQGYNEYVDFYYIKSNKNKKSNLYDIVNKETGEVIASKVRVLSVSKDSKSEIAKKYGLEHTPTKIFSANRSIAFTLYRQKPSKAKYIAQAKKYLYDAIKFLNPDETSLKINLDKIEELLSSFPEEMWDYINTTYSPEDSTNINASISLQNEIKFKLPKLGFLQEIEKITSIPLQGVSFKNYDRSGFLAKVFKYSKLNGGWGDTITIDNSMTTKELQASIRYYLSTKDVFKPTTEEENVRKYAEHRRIDYDKLKELVFGDIDKALDNISYNNTGNSDTIELSKWRESIRNYDWQSVELFSKPYENFQNTVKERIIAKFKDKNLSNGISHLEYFFNSGSFNWLNINFNNISGQYYLSDMETEANVGVETKMGGIINPFEMKIYRKPKAGENFLQEKEVFNRLAAVLHEPFHALHALSYGTKEEIELRKAFDNLYNTAFGKEMMNRVFGSGYNKGQQISYDTLYKEFTAFTTQLMLYPKQWIKNTDLRSNDIYEFIEKIQTLQDKTYEEIVKTRQKIGTIEKTITEEEQIKLSFLEKLYNYLVKALNKIIPLSKKFTNLIVDSKLVEKKVIEDVFGEVEETVTKTLKLPDNVKKSKEQFLEAMEELQSAINTLMQIDGKLFSSENITNFFTSNKFNQEVDNNQTNVQYQKQIDLQAEQDGVLEEFANSLSERFNISFDLVSEEEARAMFPKYTNEPAFFDPKTKKAYLVKGKANKTSAIHEIFTHPFLLQIEKTNPTLYKNLLKEAKNNKSVVDYVDNLYGTNQNNDHEYITRAIDLAVQGELNQQKDKTLLGRIQDFFNQLSDYLKKLFNIPKVFSSAISPNITLQQLAQFAMYGKGKMNLNPAQENIEYSLKATNVIVKNLDKIKQWEKNKSISEDVLWNKVQGLGVPKEQIELVKNSEGNTVEEKLLDFANRMSYTVEINTAKEDYGEPEIISPLRDPNTGEIIVEGEIIYNDGRNTQHYSNLTVPGGTAYTENAHVIPAMKGKVLPDIYPHHDQEFANGYLNMYGWHRSDDKLDNADLKDKESIYPGNGNPEQEGWEIVDFDEEGPVYKRVDKVTDEKTGTPTKTRRILEVQSKFQKWRLNFEHKGNKYEILENQPTDKPNVFEDHYLENGKRITGKEYNKIFKEFLDTPTSQEDAFIKLIAKQWETLMIKSIIQDSARKGYEKILFPTGNTASKVEGHQTLEEFKKQKEDRIKELEDRIVSDETITDINSIPINKFEILDNKGETIGFRKIDGEWNIQYMTGKTAFQEQLATNEQVLKGINKVISNRKEKDRNEINQLKQELERVEIEGFGALRPIWDFYENTVTNILINDIYGKESEFVNYEFTFNNDKYERLNDKNQYLKNGKEISQKEFNRVLSSVTKQDKKEGKFIDKYYVNSNAFITDEYGNTWNEVTIDENRDNQNIVFQKVPQSNSFQQFQQSLNKPNTNPILQDNQQEQIKKFAELQERLNNKEFLEGAKNAFESSEELQNVYYDSLDEDKFEKIFNNLFINKIIEKKC